MHFESSDEDRMWKQLVHLPERSSKSLFRDDLVGDLKCTTQRFSSMSWNCAYRVNYKLGNNCLRGNSFEFSLSPTASESVQKWFTSGECNGTCALHSCPNLQVKGIDRRRKSINLGTLQSAAAEDIQPNAPDQQKQTITSFVDDEAGDVFEKKQTINSINYDAYKVDSTLASFLERPTLISTLTWSLGGNIDTTISPWSLYFNTAAIKNKLENYAYIRAKLHIKIMINASPFYYGLSGVFYTPTIDLDPCPIDTTNATTGYLTSLSQRPHIWLYPQLCQGGEMVLPFFYYKNWLEIGANAHFTNMGSLDFATFVDLATASAATGTDCTVQVYAWATDVKVCGPTNYGALQSAKKSQFPTLSKESYSNNSTTAKEASKNQASTEGMFSEPLSALGSAADTASGMATIFGRPDIAKGAKVVSMASKAAASTAKTMGYTNTPNIDTVQPYKNLPFHAFSSCEISKPIDRLAFDPQNSLSDSAAAVELEDCDETDINKFCRRESYLYTATWTSAHTVDQLLFSSIVNPNMIKVDGTSPSEVYSLTPMALASRMFAWWRGDLVFRFRFICSQYHRGRVRITWDPYDDLDAVTATTATNYNHIVDIAQTPDIQIRIPYLQDSSFKTTRHNYEEVYGTSSSPSDSFDNGQLTLRVFTDQTSPVTSADISVVISVWAEDMQFSNPTETLPNVANFVLQSASEAQSPFIETQQSMPLFEGTREQDGMYDVYGGERITNWYQVMRRASLFRFKNFGSNSISDYSMLITRFRRLPNYLGFDPNGYNTADDIIGAGTSPYNWVHNIPLNMIRMCYIGCRGSINWTFNLGCTQAIPQARFYRTRKTTIDENTNIAASTGPDDTYSALFAGNTECGSSGSTQTNALTQSCLEANVPLFSKYRFQGNSPTYASNGQNEDASTADFVALELIVQPTEGINPQNIMITQYVSAGPDFSLQFFLNVPTLYETTVPVPP